MTTVGAGRTTVLLAAMALWLAACQQGERVPVPGVEGATMASGGLRATRRLYDGAPPVIPHDEFGVACGACHDGQGMVLAGVGFAPASPHLGTPESNATLRCRQCHVPALTQGLFVGNGFRGLEQDLRRGGRLYDGAPPTVPHRIHMRENCSSCHAGPGARAEIRTTHPERIRCRQCHVPVTTREANPGPLAAVTQNPEGL